MLDIGSSHPTGKLTHLVERFIMNLFGPPDRSPIDTPVIHINDDVEAASIQQLDDIEIERDDEGHVWAERKHNPTAD